MSREHVIGPYSAYAIAVKYGYTGTEEQWVKEQEANRVASEQAAQQAEQARGGAETAASRSENAADRAETAQQATESAKTDALTAIGTNKQDALDAVQNAKDGAVEAVGTAKTAATEAVQAAQDAAASAVSDAQTTAINAVDTKGKEALANISTGVDPTLSVSGKAADAKVTGDKIGQLKEDLGNLENKVGIDKKSMILGNLSLTNGQFVETSSKYAMHSNIEDKIPVEEGSIIKVDHSSFDISGFSVWDKKNKKLLTGILSDADGYVFKEDYEDICFQVKSYNNIENVPKNICLIFGTKSNVVLFADVSNQKNVVESVRNATNALRENVEKITPISFLEKELIGFSGCMRKDRKIVDLSQYGANYKHTNDIEVIEGEVYKITTKASINCPHFLLFDANKMFVASYYTITGKTDTSNIAITDYILTIPANIKYMVINTYDKKWELYEKTYINCVGKENGLTKKYFAFGDSVCRGNHPDASKSDYAWVETFGKIMGMETHNMAIGGQGYMTTVYHEKAIDTIKATDISNANLITLSFAINDASDTSCPVGTLEDTTEDSVIGCAYSCIKYIYDTVPTCQVVVCGSTPQNGKRSARLVEVNNQLKAMSERYNIPFIDLSDCPINGFNGKKGGALTSDGTHFNDDGYKLLSQFMTGKLSALFGYRQPFLI